MRGSTGLVHAAIVLVGLTICGCSTGCVAVGEGDKTIYTQPTVGKQLCDLKLARDTGAISDSEFSDAKTKTLNGEYSKKQ